MLLVLAGCVGTAPADAPPEPDCDVSWEGFTEPLIKTWCEPCHSSTVPEDERRGAPLGVDFDTWEGTVA